MPFVTSCSPQTHSGVQQTRDNFWSEPNGFQLTGPKLKVRFRWNAVNSFWIKRISPLDRWLMLQNYTKGLRCVLEAPEKLCSLLERPTACALKIQQASRAHKEGRNFRSGNKSKSIKTFSRRCWSHYSVILSYFKDYNSDMLLFYYSITWH